MEELNEKEQIVLDAIKKFTSKNNISPTYQDLTEITPFKSKSTISAILDQLKLKGKITFLCNKSRTIKIREIEGKWENLKSFVNAEYKHLEKDFPYNDFDNGMIVAYKKILKIINEMETQ